MPKTATKPTDLTDPRERLAYLRKHIAAQPDAAFSMESYFGERDDDGYVEDAESDRPNGKMIEGSCGTCGCIAGHTLFLFAPREIAPSSPAKLRDQAGGFLGLTKGAADVLFEPNNYADDFRARLQDVTREQVLQVLDHLIATGRVDWSVALKAA